MRPTEANKNSADNQPQQETELRPISPVNRDALNSFLYRAYGSGVFPKGSETLKKIQEQRTQREEAMRAWGNNFPKEPPKKTLSGLFKPRLPTDGSKNNLDLNTPAPK